MRPTQELRYPTMSNLGPTLETPRLLLRPPEQADFDGFAAMAREDATMRFIGGVASRDQAWRSMAILTGAWSLLGHSMFSVIEKETGRWIGRLGPWYPAGETGGWPGAEVGWGLMADAQGKGYAAEGATAAIDFVFDVLGWNQVIHCIHKDNAPSIRLAERLGSYRQREDVPLPPPVDVLVDIYGQTQREWRERRRRPV
jgi:RimJ/RimL family protein N-acetyltransferase